MSTTESARVVLGRAVGHLDYVTATLGRAEHGTSRDTVALARRTLKTVASELLIVRAQLAEETMIPIATGDSTNVRTR